MRCKDNYKSRTYINMLCLYLFYYSYRYILKYNSSNTSPTYSDTPLFLQLVKYAIMIYFIVYLSVKNKYMLFYSNKNKLLFFLVGVISFISLVYGIIEKNMELLEFFVIIFPILFFLNNNNHLNLEKIEKILNVFWCYSVIYEVIQVSLYFINGRLPALGYPTGRITDVRFGAAWDDPNGFVLLLVFYFFYHLIKYKKGKMLIYLFLDIVMLMLTWSGTGVICIIVTSITIFLVKAGDSKFFNHIIIFLLIGIVFAMIAYLSKKEIIGSNFSYYLLSKTGSLNGHKAGWDLSNTNILTFLGVYPKDVGGEVGYIRMLTTGGIPFLFAFLLVEFLIIKISIKATKVVCSEFRPLAYGILGYVITFLVCLFNLPQQYNFSCMGLYTAFFIIIIELTNCAEVSSVE